MKSNIKILKYIQILVISLLSTIVLVAQEVPNIIPKPKSCVMTQGYFNLTSNSVIVVESRNSLFAEIAEDFVQTIYKSTGYKLNIVNEIPSKSKSCIILREVKGLAKEAYRFSAKPSEIYIEASYPNGCFYGVQTLLQLLPAKVYSLTKEKAKWSIPCCEIEDEPFLEYRGLMIDACRYFFPKEEIMKFIDLMAMHKINVFHWHLTDDQGWRIEIKKYPKLTEIGAYRKETGGYEGISDNTPHGGFYTQEDVKEVVEYARKRYVTVVPEIELPGHASAAIAAYPELSCFPDREYEVQTTWGIKKDVFCPNAFTFQFFEDVFTELFELFPSPYYHIGGDECPRDRWKESKYCQDLMKVLGLENEDQIQIFFVQRIDKFLREKGNKQVIGWDEILDGGAVPSTIALSYRGHAPGVKAINQGMRTIFAPNRWCYFDYYQEDMEKEPKAQPLFIPLSKIYKYNPISDTVTVEKRKLILGMQACLWSEFIPDSKMLEYRAFPRVLALSETQWTPKRNKDFEDFCKRMLKGFQRLDEKDVNYSKAFFNVIFHFDRKEDFPQDVELTLDCPDTEIRYTTNGEVPTRKSLLYTAPLNCKKGDTIKAQGFNIKTGKCVGVMVEKTF